MSLKIIVIIGLFTVAMSACQMPAPTPKAAPAAAPAAVPTDTMKTNPDGGKGDKGDHPT